MTRPGIELCFPHFGEHSTHDVNWRSLMDVLLFIKNKIKI